MAPQQVFVFSSFIVFLVHCKNVQKSYYADMITMEKKQMHLLQTNCPCKSGESFDNCCNLILKDHSLAETPEKLMRSRYTAFVVQNADHLLRTWSEPHRPRTVEIDSGTIWVNLEIIDAKLPSPEQKIAHVSFIASFIQLISK